MDGQAIWGRRYVIPPRTGIASLVWMVPVFVAVVSIGALAFAFVRWRAGRELEVSDEDLRIVRSLRGKIEYRKARDFNDEKLAEEQEFLLRSLDDLEDEHSNGDLSDSEYETLRNDYMRRLAAVARARKGDFNNH